MNSRCRYATDALILLGAGLTVSGVYRIHPPSGLIVGGIVLLFLAFLGRRDEVHGGRTGRARKPAGARPLGRRVSVSPRGRVRVLR